jgi:hypothetical protein
LSTAQNQNFTIVNAMLDFTSNVLYLQVAFVDADDGSPIGINSYVLPLTGAVTDGRGRTVVAATPANIITAASTLKTNIAAAIATAAGLGKLKP